MSQKQQKRARILSALCEGGISTASAAELMGLSRRQVRRLKVRFQQEEFATVVHGNQGRAPKKKTHPAVLARIISLCGENGKYKDFNICHLQELLARFEGITIGRSTLDRLLKAHGLRKPRLRRAVVRKQRERKEAEGMMLQMDGSPHDWLEGRGPRMCLMGSIDDATSKVVYLHFHPTEDQAGYLRMLREVTKECGLPMSLYHDRHTILLSPKQPSIEEELAGKKPMSQVQRVIAELGIESIAARSPQAKGRVERLWGTLQDRLIKEMRLAALETREEANAFLPGFLERFNGQFAQEAQQKEGAWVKVDKDFDWVYYFSTREQRIVKANHTVSWLGQTLQILPASRSKSLAGKTVYVHVTPEREIYLYHGKSQLKYTVLEAKAPHRSESPSSPKESEATLAATPSATNKTKNNAPSETHTPTATKQKPSDRAGSRRWLYGANKDHHSSVANNPSVVKEEAPSTNRPYAPP